MDDHYYNAMVLLRDRLLTKALLIYSMQCILSRLIDIYKDENTIKNLEVERR